MKWRDPYSPGTIFGLPIIIDTTLRPGEIRIIQSVDPMLVQVSIFSPGDITAIYNKVVKELT